MGKLKKKLQDMSLKKTLLLISVICLSIVSILSAVTILTASGFRQKMLDRRPVIITTYTIDSGTDSASLPVTPQEYAYGELTGKDLTRYWLATVLMILLPVMYIIAGSVAAAKLYYRLKLKIPLEKLENGMHHISVQDLDFETGYSSGDEMGRLCGAFEQMKDEIYKSNCKMWDMLQERKMLTSSVAHDLRTPITVIKGYLDYLSRAMDKGVLSADILAMTVRNMEGAADRLERYVDCIKDIQKIEDIEIRKEAVNLKGFIEDLGNDFSLVAKNHTKCLELNNVSRDIWIETDREMLAKVLENIFDNALRFARETIVLQAEEKDGCAAVRVLDDGSGFAPEEFGCAASPFYSSPVNGGSFGIGLAVSRMLCERLDAVLKLANRPGAGAAVTVKLGKITENFSKN